MMTRFKMWAKQLKRQVLVLYYAYRNPHAPLHAKLFAICVVAYAFSPVDLIPDFIPILGYLDDLILVPLGVMAALKLMPEDVLVDARQQADERMKAQEGKPKNWFTGGLIIAIWLILAVILLRLLWARIFH